MLVAVRQDLVKHELLPATTEGVLSPHDQEQYVTLDQASALVNRSKRTLEALRDLPEPDVRGGSGKPHEWRWSRLRRFLSEKYDRLLPDRFPNRRHG